MVKDRSLYGLNFLSEFSPGTWENGWVKGENFGKTKNCMYKYENWGCKTTQCSENSLWWLKTRMACELIDFVVFVVCFPADKSATCLKIAFRLYFRLTTTTKTDVGNKAPFSDSHLSDFLIAILFKRCCLWTIWFNYSPVSKMIVDNLWQWLSR